MISKHQDEPVPWAWLAALTLLAAVLRAVALDQQLWYDEMALAVSIAPMSLGEIATTYASQNQHMLYSLLARVSQDLFGVHNWSLRLPAVLFGVAAVPALYFCARLVASQREALLTAALLAVSYHHVWFSQNARGYTGLALWTLVTTYFFLRGMREPGLRPWVWYGVTMALGMYTHLTMGFVAAGHFVVALWMVPTWKRQSKAETEEFFRKMQRGEIKLPSNTVVLHRTPAQGALLGFVIAGVLTLALYAPVLTQVFARTVGEDATAAPVSSEWTNPLWLVLETVRGLAAGAGGAFGYVALPVGGLLLLVGLISYWEQDRYVVGLMVLPGVITAAVMLALGHNLWPRFFFFAIGFGMMLLVRGALAAGGWLEERVSGTLRRSEASGLSQEDLRHKRTAWGTALALLMILASAATVRSAWIYPKQDFSGALHYIEAERRPDEPVVLAGLAVFPFRDFYRRDWPQVKTATELRAARAPGGRMWLVYASPIFVQSRQPEIWNIIEQEFETVRVFRGTMGDGAVYVCRSKQQEPRE